MSRPLLLDLFCRAGGAAMGYSRAGFDVVGVDIEPQKRYPFEFIQGDALAFLWKNAAWFDAIHASPPCQFGTALAPLHRSKGDDYDKKHPNLIPDTRRLLRRSGKPYVIENVEGSRFAMIEPSMICGTMFGLQTDCGAVLRRHRLFETNWLFMVGLQCMHKGTTLHVAGSNTWTGHVEMPKTIGIYGCKAFDRPVKGEDGKQLPPGKAQRTISMNGNGAHDHAEESRRRTISVHDDHPRDPSIERSNRRTIGVTDSGQPLSGARTKTISITGSTPQQNVVHNRVRETFPVSAARTAMGIDWMPMSDLSQAIPPAYTEFIGLQLLDVVATWNSEVKA